MIYQYIFVRGFICKEVSPSRHVQYQCVSLTHLMLTSQKDSPRAASCLSPTSCRRRQLRNYCRCFAEISCDNSCHTTAGARSCRDQNMLFCFDAVLAWKTTLKEIVEDGFEKKRLFIFWLVDAAFLGLITYLLC